MKSDRLVAQASRGVALVDFIEVFGDDLTDEDFTFAFNDGFTLEGDLTGLTSLDLAEDETFRSGDLEELEHTSATRFAIPFLEAEDFVALSFDGTEEGLLSLDVEDSSFLDFKAIVP